MKNIFNKNKKPMVDFVTSIPGLTTIEECLPKSAQSYIPDWWKKIPTQTNEVVWGQGITGNVKVCPSFADYFTRGFIIPMWTDCHLYYNSDTKEYKWASSDSKFSFGSHGNSQYIDYVDHKFLNKNSFFIFKLLLPWQVFTPKGYSLYQFPTFFHFNEDFSVVPGVRDTDSYHQINMQIIIHSDKKEIFIPRGTPLAQYIPFKRDKIDFNVRQANKKDLFKIDSHFLNISTQYIPTTSYLKKKKEQ